MEGTGYGTVDGLELTAEDVENLFEASGVRSSTFYSNAVELFDSLDHVPEFPMKLLWEIHSRCHLQCEHCWASTNIEVDKPDLDVQLERAREFAEKGGLEVSFSGGEPLLSPRIEPLIRELTDRGVSCQILTNGELLVDQFDWIGSTMGDGDRIQISVDGPREVHESQRPGSDFDRLDRGARLLADTDVYTSAHFTATPLNLHSIDEVMEWCLDVDVDHLSVGPIYPTQYPSGADLWERFDQSEYVRVVAENLQEHDLDTDVFLPVQFFERLPPSAMSSSHRDGVFRLEAGTTHMQIQADGRVFPGSRFVYPEYSSGTIGENSIEELWNTDNELWGMIRSGRDLSETKCADCRWAGYCEGGSTRIAYRFYETIHRPDPFCTHVPERAKRVSDGDQRKSTNEPSAAR